MNCGAEDTLIAWGPIFKTHNMTLNKHSGPLIHLWNTLTILNWPRHIWAIFHMEVWVIICSTMLGRYTFWIDSSTMTITCCVIHLAMNTNPIGTIS